MQASLVARQFKALGYRYYPHRLVVGRPNADDVAADVNLNVAGPSDFVSALYDESAGARGDQAAPASIVADRRARPPLQAQRLRARCARRACATSPGPKFVFGHVLLPHPPTVFDRDGRVHDRGRGGALSEKERFERQLDYTNTRLTRDPRRVCWPSPRTSARSSSSRPTRDPNPPLYRGDPQDDLRLGRPRPTTTSRSSTGS